MSSVLQELQEWYFAQCDGDWEHQNGITIANIDNPGWMFTVELAETELADVAFEDFQESLTDELNWISCAKRGTAFSGNGGPLMLERIINIFLDWAKSAMIVRE